MMTERLTTIKGVRVKVSDDIDGITFVLVPDDTLLPLQELVLVTCDDTTIPLENVLESYFGLQEGETVDMNLLQQQAEQARDCLTGMCPHVSPLTLKRSAEEGTIQKAIMSDYISMYFDESAPLKRRPLNSRANQYLRAANPKNNDETIYGNVFLACLQEKEPVSLAIDALEKEPWFQETK